MCVWFGGGCVISPFSCLEQSPACTEKYETCARRIASLRHSAAIAVVLICIYTLYYLRGVDEYAFLVGRR